jgi:serine/threonine-protein phosphatase 2A regulatory subunit B''
LLILSSPSSLTINREYLTVDDWDYLIQDIIDTHPGLKFLREAREFHSRYIKTVVARIYYNCNRSWSGKLTVQELRRSNFLSVNKILD